MSDLKDYEVRTTSGYVTTIQYSDADAKLRGLLGKDVHAEKTTAAKKKADREAAAAKKKAEAEAAAKQKAEAEAAAAKGGPVPANKQAPAPENK